MGPDARRVRFESLERRALMCADHGLLEVDPTAAPAPAESTVQPVSEAAGVTPAAIGDPLLPDLFPLFSEPDEYVYGWEYDVAEPLMPGRVLLRLTTAMANQGRGAMELRGGNVLPNGSQEVHQRIFTEGGGFTDRLAGTFTYHEEHEHIHFDGFAAYQLRAVTPGNGVGAVVAAGDKVSFCLLDIDRFNPSIPGSPANGRYFSCGSVQGISAGWADVYVKGLADQWIDITDVADGQYWLEVVADPANHLLESDETNNVDRILIDVRRPSRDPMVVAHNPVGQFPAPASSIEFVFDQNMNTGSFSVAADVLAFGGPTGADLRGQITGSSWVNPTTLRVSFNVQPATGPYTMTIGPDIRAADDNAPLDQDRDRNAGEAVDDRYTATFTVSDHIGPDAFGYRARAVPVEAINLVAGAPGVFQILDNEDDLAASVNLGTDTFNFYGATFTGSGRLFVNTNGMITFGTGDSAFTNGDLTTQPSQPTIAALWDDLRTDVNSADMVLGKFEDTNGDGVRDRLIIEWSDVRRHSDSTPAPAANLTFQAILTLNTGTVPGAMVFNYVDITTGPTYTNGASATVGIKGGGDQGGNRLMVSYNRGNHPYVATGRAVRIERSSAVAGRHLFYNASAFDGADSAADARDDAAVAPDKSAFLPGAGRASFANVSGYARGINGVMVDLAGLFGRTPTVSDFEFKVGRDGAPANWASAATPTLSVRRGAGVGGTDRVTLVWPERAVRNAWLQVTVKPTVTTGLPAADVFYFGHLAGETGDGGASSAGASVGVMDLARTRAGASPSTSVPLANRFDHNRDRRVNALDSAVARGNHNGSLAWLNVAAPAAPAGSSAAGEVVVPPTATRERPRRRPGLLLDETVPA